MKMTVFGIFWPILSHFITVSPTRRYEISTENQKRVLYQTWLGVLGYPSKFQGCQAPQGCPSKAPKRPQMPQILALPSPCPLPIHSLSTPYPLPVHSLSTPKKVKMANNAIMAKPARQSAGERRLKRTKGRAYEILGLPICHGC